jgi:xanthine dehydrogenase small subunit
VPASEEALARILADEPDATVVAGSTDVGLWVTKQMRSLNPVVFINHLAELQSIAAGEGGSPSAPASPTAVPSTTIARKVPTLGR